MKFETSFQTQVRMQILSSVKSIQTFGWIQQLFHAVSLTVARCIGVVGVRWGELSRSQK